MQRRRSNVTTSIVWRGPNRGFRAFERDHGAVGLRFEFTFGLIPMTCEGAGAKDWQKLIPTTCEGLAQMDWQKPGSVALFLKCIPSK